MSGTLPSTDNTFTIAYPSGLDKSNMAMIGFGFYRNASWYFNTNAVSVAFTNANISVTIPTDFSYIKGLAYAIIYIKI